MAAHRRPSFAWKKAVPGVRPFPSPPGERGNANETRGEVSLTGPRSSGVLGQFLEAHEPVPNSEAKFSALLHRPCNPSSLDRGSKGTMSTWAKTPKELDIQLSTILHLLDLSTAFQDPRKFLGQVIHFSISGPGCSLAVLDLRLTGFDLQVFFGCSRT